MTENPVIPLVAGTEGPTNYDVPSPKTERQDSSAGNTKSGIMQRAMEMTADKLSRSKSIGKQSQLSQSQPTLPAPSLGHRRIFSLSRKGKERATEPEADVAEGERPSARSQVLSSSLKPRFRPRSSPAPKDDDSPFVTPHSPTLKPIRPMLSIFRDVGSMRAGTQTLIQALQAMPWAEDPDNDDDAMAHDFAATEAESDDDDKPGSRLASSIHAIYRPLARSRFGTSGFVGVKSNVLPSVADTEDIPRSEEPEPIMSDEEVEDFEPPHSARPTFGHKRNLSNSVSYISDGLSSHAQSARSGSMSTVKVQRRARLAEKLRDVFELNGINEVISEMPCWLLRSVLLQGYMYLTDSYLCFFAHMPSREDQVLKSGSLSKRTQRTKRWIKHWFILKNDVLSWYQSSSDPYFPHGVIDLRYAISCDPVNEKDIRLRANQKTIKLSADSIPSRDEWVKAIRKIMFKAQNMGDSVKIAIPYSAIIDVDRSSALDFSETVEVKVADQTDNYAVDSYFFAYFQDLPAALEQIRDVVRAYREVLNNTSPLQVIDTTTIRSSGSPNHIADRTQSLPSADSTKSPSSVFRFTSLLRPLQESLPMPRLTSIPDSPEANEAFTHISKRGNSSFVPVTASPKSESPALNSSPTDYTYPPSVTASPSSSEFYPSTTTRDNTSAWSVGMPSWFKIPARSRVFSSSSSTKPGQQPGRVAASEMTSAKSLPGNLLSAVADFGRFSMPESPEIALDTEFVEKFHSYFALDEKETLLGAFPGYIIRVIPSTGRLYISTNYFCFKSTGPLSTRIRMILPIRDVLSTEASKTFHFGRYGLVVIIRGHEELFFEFTDEERRAAFVALLERQQEYSRRYVTSGETQSPSIGRRDALILEEFAPPQTASSIDDGFESPDPMSESLPAVMFTSTSSTFLTFKPKESLHFTFLTIGSRGDVQPYIALAKGLMADGHRVRIATHGEFKEWVESHGIEFGYVGGDPAELMRICVENGMFTVSFLKESMQKFRGWIDDLLKTSWEACQGTDVLIESPSAMGGYHIAEALKIPYFRAFTMTWSRTRAYPHAFAVPEHKMGGNYNYMSYVLFDQVFWRATAGQINRWRRNTLSLGSTNLDKMEPHKIPFLYNFSPVVVPPPLDWPDWIRVTGYWFLDDADVGAKKWTPPPDLLEFIDSAHKAQKKVVYIGFGSIVVSDPRAMTRCVIDAIVQSGVHAILSKGWSDRLVKNAAEVAEPEEPLPPQIYPVAAIPHDWLFKRIDAACHHGGAGTTGASLRAGIPTVIKPFFGDQFFWADRVEALGIGSAVRKLTVRSLADALVAAATDQKQIERARAVGEEIRAENGVATAIEAIYRDMEYAKSLVKGAEGQREDEHARDAENATIREYSGPSTPARRSGDSSSSSPPGAASDWSVISDHDSDVPHSPI